MPADQNKVIVLQAGVARAGVARAEAYGIIISLLLIFILGYVCATKVEHVKRLSSPQKESAIVEAANHLIHEHSPYLLQHAHNPVDWHPWGFAAFSLARREQKPILLSIGFSACHWCHVMEKESFEDAETARLMNKDFVNIKVDREERPDVDQYYIHAVSAMGISPGWPLTVFLTPDLKAFAGGTYFPPTASLGLPAFKDVLTRINEVWTKHRSQAEKVASLSSDIILNSHNRQSTTKQSETEIIEKGIKSLLREFDSEYGGFGDERKYPMVSVLQLFMQASFKNYLGLPGGQDTCKKVALITLDNIACGGIHDQVGGGFHRYSVDRQWHVPHFEKMLTDNALLGSAFINAYQLTGRPYYADMARDAIDYVSKDLRSPEGAFYSSRDADSAGKEGVFYVYRPEEIKGLSEADTHWLEDVLNISKEGNFERGSSVPRLTASPETLARRFQLSYEQFRERLHSLSNGLLETRSRRAQPRRDEKIICSWNAMMVSALADVYGTLGNDAYLLQAKQAARFILSQMRAKDSLQLKHVMFQGVLSEQSFLDDYAYTSKALLDLAALDTDPVWINEAQRLTDEMLQNFWNEESGVFLYSSQKDLPAQTLDNTDAGIPASASLAIMDLLRFEQLTGEKKYGDVARKALAKLEDEMNSNPGAYASMLCALDFSLGPLYDIVLINNAAPSAEKPFVQCIHSFYFPKKVMLTGDVELKAQYPQSELKDKTAAKGKVTAVICGPQNCLAPCTNLEQLAQELQSITGSANLIHTKANVKLSSSLTADQAIGLVTLIPEVHKWMLDLAGAKHSGAGSAGFTANNDKNIWNIQAFESFPDRNVTFGFYEVDAVTHKVRRSE